MARKNWKQPISITLSKDALKLLRDLAVAGKVSRSAIVEQAILSLSVKQ